MYVLRHAQDFGNGQPIACCYNRSAVTITLLLQSLCCYNRSAAERQAHQLVSRARGDLLGLHFHEMCDPSTTSVSLRASTPGFCSDLF